MSIRFANHTDIPKLRHIMKVVFGDLDSFLDRFFNYKFKNNALVYEVDQSIVSVAFLLPAFLNFKSLTYIFGCATLPNYRGKGIMTALLDEAFQIVCQQNQLGLSLVPASEALSQYYKTLGFQNQFYHNISHFHLTDLLPHKSPLFSLQTLTPAQYADLRDSSFSVPSHLVWDVTHFQLVQEEYVIEKGNFFAIKNDEELLGIGFFYTHHFQTFIPELLTGLNPVVVAQLFFQYIETNSITIYTPGDEHCYGLMKWNPKCLDLKPQSAYLAFALE